jgi:hypothetical protein
VGHGHDHRQVSARQEDAVSEAERRDLGVELASPGRGSVFDPDRRLVAQLPPVRREGKREVELLGRVAEPGVEATGLEVRLASDRGPASHEIRARACLDGVPSAATEGLLCAHHHPARSLNEEGERSRRRVLREGAADPLGGVRIEEAGVIVEEHEDIRAGEARLAVPASGDTLVLFTADPPVTSDGFHGWGRGHIHDYHLVEARGGVQGDPKLVRSVVTDHAESEGRHGSSIGP